MNKSACLVFPFKSDYENNCLKRAENINDVLCSAMLIFLRISPGQRRGNLIGSFLPSLKHKLIPSSVLPSFEDDLKKELTDNFPEAIIHQIIMTQDQINNVIKLNVNITFSTSLTNISQFNIIV